MFFSNNSVQCYSFTCPDWQPKSVEVVQSRIIWNYCCTPPPHDHDHDHGRDDDVDGEDGDDDDDGEEVEDIGVHPQSLHHLPLLNWSCILCCLRCKSLKRQDSWIIMDDD